MKDKSPVQIRRFSQLSAPRQALVRLFQSINFGEIRGLVVRNSEPVFNPSPTVLIDLLLEVERESRQEIELSDFVLCDEVCKFLGRLDRLKNARIERIEVRAGTPRRILYELPLTEALQ
jgi:hypothetical protein